MRWSSCSSPSSSCVIVFSGGFSYFTDILDLHIGISKLTRALWLCDVCPVG